MMARMHFTLVKRGGERARASLASLAEAVCNAHLDDLALNLNAQSDPPGIVFNGALIIEVVTMIDGWEIVAEIRPAAGMILFAAYVQNALPARATVTWRDGWPFFRCPPNDEREGRDDPSPLLPNELELA